jgi:hypothetical protein
MSSSPRKLSISLYGGNAADRGRISRPISTLLKLIYTFEKVTATEINADWMVIAPGSIDMDVYRSLQISESGKVDLLTMQTLKLRL